MRLDRNNILNDNLNTIRLQVVDCGHACSGPEWIGNIVNPLYARLYYILAGDPYIEEKEVRYRLEVGKCYLLPAGYSFSHSCLTGMEQLYFHINLYDGGGGNLLRGCKRPIEYRPEDGKIERLVELFKKDDQLSALMLRQEIYASLLELIKLGGVELEPMVYSRCVRLAIDYIGSHLSMQLGVAELAANSFVSVSTLSKRFRAEVGMTLGSYIDETVMREAERLLCKSELTVLEISERFGYCDQFYFSRRFKARFGETPQKYRRSRPI